MEGTPPRVSGGRRVSGVVSVESCDALQEEVAALKANTQRQLAELAAFCEVADVTVKTAQREAADLRSAVLAGGPGGGPVSAEQALFALTSATATKEALVERMQRRCRRTHADLVRIERKVAQAAEERKRRPSVAPQDLEALRQELADLAPAVEASAREAGQLKADSIQKDEALQDLKRQLAALEAANERVAKQVASRAAEAARREEDVGRTHNEVATAQRQLAALRASTAVAPPVAAMDFITLKAEVAALKNSVASLTRKCEVAALVQKSAARLAKTTVTPGKTPGRAGARPGMASLDGLLTTRSVQPAVQ